MLAGRESVAVERASEAAWRAGRTLRGRRWKPATPNPARPLAWRDIRGTIRRHANELVSTEAEAASLEALRVATGETRGDMERHTMRRYLIAERIADMRHVP
jgi:hypothetical protein